MRVVAAAIIFLVLFVPSLSFADGKWHIEQRRVMEYATGFWSFRAVEHVGADDKRLVYAGKPSVDCVYELGIQYYPTSYGDDPRFKIMWVTVDKATYDKHECGTTVDDIGELVAADTFMNISTTGR